MAQGPQDPRGRHNDRHGHGSSHRRPPMEQRYYDCASAEQMQAVMDALNGQSFDGRLTTQKYAKINHCSQDTALRDIQSLMEKGILRKTEEGGRSTNYELT